MKNKYVPYLLLLPAFLLICIFKIYPVLTTLRQAFVVDGALSLATFQRVFSEKTFWNCLKVTAADSHFLCAGLAGFHQGKRLGRIPHHFLHSFCSFHHRFCHGMEPDVPV